MSSYRVRTLVLVGAVLALLSVGTGTAAAKARTGAVTDPVEGLGASRDLVRVTASYDPANGTMRARVRFSRPLAPGTLVHMWFRSDRSGACRGKASDIRFQVRTDAGLPSFEVVRDRPAGFSEGRRKVSADRRELILAFGTPMVARLDLRCVHAETLDDAPRSKKVYDRLNKPIVLK